MRAVPQPESDAANPRPPRAAEPLGLPHVTRLTRDLVVHDLAAEAAEIISGVFVPESNQVVLDVQAAFSFLGNSRGALLLYVGQPAEPGGLLHDAGAAPLPGVTWYSAGSVNGECAWANTSSRRFVLDVRAGQPVTWAVLAGIIGGASVVAVPGAGPIAITRNGVTALVASPDAATVTPVALGRPGYSYDQRLPGMDDGLPPLPFVHPTHVSAGDAWALVSGGGERPRLGVIDVPGRAIVREVVVPSGAPLGSDIAGDESFALVGTDSGALMRVSLPSAEVVTAHLGGELVDTAILESGVAAVADRAGAVHRVRSSDLGVEATIALPAPPCALRVAQDGGVWVLCRPEPPAPARLVGVDAGVTRITDDFELPFAGPVAFDLVPVRGQTSQLVRTAWVVFDGGRFCEFNIAGVFAGQVHTFHNGAFGEGIDAGGIAVNDFGEIWVTQPAVNRLYKWIGGRFQCRPVGNGHNQDIIFGEYCEVLVYGGHPLER